VSDFKASRLDKDHDNARRTMEAFISPFMPATASGEFEITSSYTTAHNGVVHVYTHQVIGGVPVMNGVGQLNLDRDGNVLSSSDSFWAGKVPAQQTPNLSKAEAARKFIRAMDEGDGVVPVTNDPADSAQQMWVIDGKHLQLAWVFEVDVGNLEHVLEVAVDVTTGNVLSSYDLVIGDDDFVDNAGAEGPQRKLAQAGSTAKYRGWGVPNMTPELGSSQLHEDPQNRVPNASPLGWHQTDDGQAYRDTRGNNVFAQENSADSSSLPPNGYRPASQSADALEFDFPMDFNKDPASGENLDATVTNLFYMNNIMHDLLYTYGFDEESGNFQSNNFGKGGSDNDPLVANALDGSGTNNANMYTPRDGSAPVMRMYRWNYLPGEDLPSSLDGLIVAHEYVHGLSNRLTGGPANPGCLSTTKSGGMGEGWSDYVGVMMSIGEASGFEGSVGVGSWIVGGKGIRRYEYSTEFSVNPYTFADVNAAGDSVHEIGTVWATMLWDMSADLVREVGFNDDIYQSSGETSSQGGNNIAMQNVIDGMKIQPCSPNFVDARDAILMADSANYNGVHQCIIWRAFARRGLGAFAAHTGSAEESFCVPENCRLDESPCVETRSPTPAPYLDQDLGELARPSPSVPSVVFLEGSTQGRTDTYGNPAGDVRVSFSLPTGVEDGALQIDTCSDRTDYDSYVWLLDSEGNLIAENDDSRDLGVPCNKDTSSYLKLATDELQAGEEYTLVVDGYDTASGTFGLTISLAGSGSNGPVPTPTPKPTLQPTGVPPSTPTPQPTGVSTPTPTFQPMESSICDALYLIQDKLGNEELCALVLALGEKYDCGLASPTASPTVVPTLSPTAHPTLAPTSAPTLTPTSGETTDGTAVLVQFEGHRNARFTSDKPVYITLLGQGTAETTSASLGLVVSRETRNVELVVEAPSDIGLLRAVRICLDPLEPDRTRIVRSGFEIVFEGEIYELASTRGAMRTLRPGKCLEESLALA